MRAIKQLVILSLFSTLSFGQLFINEIDYDQPIADDNEFIEIAGPAGTYSGVSVELLNAGVTSYATIDLGTFVLSDESAGFGFFVLSDPGVSNSDLIPPGWADTEHSIQNGAPDAVVLKVNGIIIDAVSYEGDVADMENAGEDYQAAGELAQSVSRLGLDGSPWEETASTPGAVNTNQTFDPSANFSPVANAGPDQSVDSGETVTLDGSSSSDSDGSIASYLWSQVSGSTVTLTNANTAVASFVVPTVTETSSWVFMLTVTDDDGATDTDEITITAYISTTLTIAEARTQPVGTLVTVTGLVNSTNLSSSGSDYTFQDATAGIDLYFTGAKLDLGLGDEITVTGAIGVYADKIEVIPTFETDIVVNSTGNTLPDPQVITVAELLTNGSDYESELIRINNVSNNGSGDPWPTAAGNANVDITDNGSDISVMRIDDETDVDATPEPSWPLDVIGIGSVNYGVYQITPRMLTDLISDPFVPSFTNESFDKTFYTEANEITFNIDIVPVDGSVSISAAKISYGTDGSFQNDVTIYSVGGNSWLGVIPAQDGNSLLQFKVVATQSNGTDYESRIYKALIASSTPIDISAIQANPSGMEGQVVTVDGILTIGSGVLQAGMTKAYIQDGSGRGINLYADDEYTLVRGDRVTAVGVVELYYTTVEITDFNYKVVSQGNTLPAPANISVGQANSPDWEGTFIEFEGEITVSAAITGGTKLTIEEGGNSTIVMIWNSTGINTASLTVGSSWSFTGVGSQYSTDFQLLVGYEDDIKTATSVDHVSMNPHDFSLAPAFPNPFNPSTKLSWSLPEQNAFTIKAFNLQGREVAIIAAGNLPAGQYTSEWNASNLSSGLYIIQLQAGEHQAMQKVLLVK
ncbi:MAG: T9SS type A sorting domain-containing protein [Candidatus Marinimicrobia bacterium]|nr:T9SS type A sorting domain-containing protein [Candidatus Neomarinimicrobiota bacterium]